ncbi:hypothetical protein B620_gp30 [Croceibacter phage P2559S]|uniref:hypothetical protein n=1 Tax=Croceibacter phage P2559S TaxID=1176422 RepID=UPI0002688EB9|nr:hypothetical protein B620_gp30 [Croceibacter phage P2559S]AFM54808.1 hypothetical protein P2559S_30 [Croceibacter phage P2559S]
MQLSNDVLRYSDLQLGYSEKKTRLSKLYISLKDDYVPAFEMHVPGVGLDYYTGKLGFGVSAGVMDKEFYYGGRLSFAIW